MKSKYSFLQPYKANKVRIGNDGDGAYVLEQKSLQEVEIVLSYGCGWDTSFEESFSKVRRVPIYIFDPTLIDISMLNLYINKFGSIKGIIRYSAKLVSFTTQLIVHKLLGRKVTFVNEGIAVKNTSKYKTMDYHFQKYKLEGKNVLLKIDVEGAEYEFWLTKNFENLLKDVIQLTIEIHDVRNKYDNIKAFYEMLAKQFYPIHIHGNNYAGTFEEESVLIPYVIEVTWVKKAFVKNIELDESLFPSKEFDRPNNMEIHDIDLMPIWS